MSCEGGRGSRGAESEDEGSSLEEDGKEERDLVQVDGIPKEERRWDCESVLRCVACDAKLRSLYCFASSFTSSTYSTLYNHPTRIVEPRATNFPNGGGKIELSRKTGIPLGVVPGSLPKENHPSRGGRYETEQSSEE